MFILEKGQPIHILRLSQEFKNVLTFCKATQGRTVTKLTFLKVNNILQLLLVTIGNKKKFLLYLDIN